MNQAFNPAPWELPARAAGLDPRWVVDAALHGAAVGGYDTEGPLAGLLGRLGLCAAVADHPGSVPAATPRDGILYDQFTPGWAARVLDACDRAGSAPRN